MRDRFINELIKATQNDVDTLLCVADLGYSVIEPFKDLYPERFINVGVAEQNMVNYATGQALDGRQVFCYSIANFPTFRCAEQLRNGVGYHNLPVCIVSVGGGLAYGAMGYSHHAIEDYGLMRLLMGFRVYAPIDPEGVSRCMKLILERKSPAYLRLHKAKEAKIEIQEMITNCSLMLNKSDRKDVLILTTGNITMRALNIANERNYTCIGVEVWGKDIDEPLLKIIEEYEHIVTFEDHILAGGFASWLGEECMRKGLRKSINPVYIDRPKDGLVGSEDYLLNNRSILKLERFIELEKEIGKK